MVTVLGRLFILLLCTGLAWAGGDLAQPTLPRVSLIIEGKVIQAEVARSSQELETGLMFRNKMGDNSGMLFCLPQEGPADFWMKNTLLPLSVAYLDRAGLILELHDMEPQDTTIIHSSSDHVYYALEMNQGWFVLNKIGPGATVKVEKSTLEKLRTATLCP